MRAGRADVRRVGPAPSTSLGPHEGELEAEPEPDRDQEEQPGVEGHPQPTRSIARPSFSMPSAISSSVISSDGPRRITVPCRPP